VVDVGFVVYGVVVGYVFLSGPRFPSFSIIRPMLHDDIPVCDVDPVCSEILLVLLNEPLENIFTLTICNSLKIINMDRNLSEI
jgi:hypothetical protein